MLGEGVLVLLGDCVKEWEEDSQDRLRWDARSAAMHAAYSLSQRDHVIRTRWTPPISAHVLRYGL